MLKALDVAHYFLNRVDREVGDVITNLKLQKLVYYAQAWSMVFRGEPLFDEPVQAWVNGPVVYSLWKEYQAYEKAAIPDNPSVTQELQKDEIKVLQVVWVTYGELSASKLWKLSHSEAPWNNAREGLAPHDSSQNPIDPDDMKNYYSEFGGLLNNEPWIEKRVTELDKDETVIGICLKDGTYSKVALEDLGDYIARNSGNLEYEQSDLPVEGVDLLC